MSKVTRQTQTIFANAASNNGVFGSAADNTKVYSNSLPILMGKGAWNTGWLSAVLGTKNFPPLEEFQSLNYINTYQLTYLFQEGIPEYDSGTIYFQNSIVKKPGTYQLYGSLIDNNTGNSLTNATDWKFLVDFAATVVGTDVYNYAVDTGTANHFVIAPNPAVPNMSAGNTIFIKPGHNITGACDVSPNAVTTASIKLFDGTDPVAGMMVTTGFYCLVSDGTHWVLLNPSYTFGSAAFLNANNTANNIPLLDSSGRYPALNGSQITNLPAQFSSSYSGGVGKIVLGAVTIQVGTQAVSSNAQAVVFPTAFSGVPVVSPFPGGAYGPQTTDTNASVTSVTATGCTLNYFSNPGYWIAVGPT